MIAEKDPPSPAAGAENCQFSPRRLIPLVVIAVVSIAVIVFGWHQHISFETVARHHEALRDFIAVHEVSAVAAYLALYIAAVALSLPIGFYLTVTGGILFGV